MYCVQAWAKELIGIAGKGSEAFNTKLGGAVAGKLEIRERWTLQVIVKHDTD